MFILLFPTLAGMLLGLNPPVFPSPFQKPFPHLSTVLTSTANLPSELAGHGGCFPDIPLALPEPSQPLRLAFPSMATFVCASTVAAFVCSDLLGS